LARGGRCFAVRSSGLQKGCGRAITGQGAVDEHAAQRHLLGPMTLDELLAAVAAEPGQVITRNVLVPPPELLAQMSQSRGKGMLLADFIAACPQPGERRTLAYRHIIEPGCSEATVSAWETRHPQWPLPADLRELLLRADGVHLWANAETGRAHLGLAPLADWQGARTAMYGASADSVLLDDRYLAISYHQDGGVYVVLDVLDQAYFLMDPAGPDRGSMIARCVPELLAWLWRTRIAPSRDHVTDALSPNDAPPCDPA
jgi:hypothetical protein